MRTNEVMTHRVQAAVRMRPIVSNHASMPRRSRGQLNLDEVNGASRVGRATLFYSDRYPVSIRMRSKSARRALAWQLPGGDCCFSRHQVELTVRRYRYPVSPVRHVANSPNTG